MIVTIHQPNYLPWIGYFNKIVNSDVFVILDDVELSKNSVCNRNKIKTSEGWMWLTVPIKIQYGDKINQVRIDNTKTWNQKHKKSIYVNYKKTRFFENYWHIFESIYDKNHESLVNLNFELLRTILHILKIDVKIVFSSALNITTSGSNRILDICSSLKCDTYLSGIGGKDYLNLDNFTQNNITEIGRAHV